MNIKQEMGFTPNDTDIYTSSISKYKSFDNKLNKKIWVEDGKLLKEANASFNTGLVENISVNTFDELVELFESLADNECVGIGMFGNGLSHNKIGFDLNNDELRRTKENLVFNEGISWMFIDIDDSHFNFEETMDKFYSICPEFKDVTYYKRVSSSGNIKGFEKENYHIWFKVDNGLSISKLKDVINDRLWDNSLGYIKLGKAGSKLVRNVLGIDMATFSPERLIFEAAPTLIGDIELNIDRNRIVIGEYEIVNISNMTAPNTRHLIQAEKAKYNEESKTLLKSQPNYSNMTNRSIALLSNNAIPLDLILKFDNGIDILARDINESFDDLSLIDPFDHKNREGKAKFYWNHGYNKVIHSIRSSETYKFEAIKTNKATKVKNITTRMEGRLDIETAVKLFRDDMSERLGRPAPKLTNISLFEYPAGLGKSEYFSKLAANMKGDQRFHFYTATHILASELYEKTMNFIDARSSTDFNFMINSSTLKGNIKQIMGRKVEGMCLHENRHQPLFSTYAYNICKKCPFRKDCNYNKQFETYSNFTIYMHSHLFLGLHRNVDAEQFIDSVVIIDENAFNDMIITDELQMKHMPPVLKHQFRNNEWNAHGLVPEYEEYLAICKSDEIPDDMDSKIFKMLENLTTQDLRGIEIEDNLLRFTKLKKLSDHILLAREILILDATGHRDFYELMFNREIEHVSALVEIQPNCHILQYMERSYSLKYCTDNIDKVKKHVLGLIKHHKSLGKKVGLMSYGKFANKSSPDYWPELDSVDAVGYFFNLKGTNIFEDMDVNIILGRAYRNEDAVYDLMYEFNLDVADKIETIKHIATLDGDDAYETNVVAFSDPTVQSIHIQGTLAEMNQVLARPRMLWPCKDKEIILITNAYHDYPIYKAEYNLMDSNDIGNLILNYININDTISTKPAICSDAIGVNIKSFNYFKGKNNLLDMFQTVVVDVIKPNRHKSILEFYINMRSKYQIQLNDLPQGYKLV